MGKKSLRISLGKIWYQKSLGTSFRFVGLVTHCSALYGLEGQGTLGATVKQKNGMGWDGIQILLIAYLLGHTTSWMKMK